MYSEGQSLLPGTSEQPPTLAANRRAEANVRDEIMRHSRCAETVPPALLYPCGADLAAEGCKSPAPDIKIRKATVHSTTGPYLSIYIHTHIPMHVNKQLHILKSAHE